jgi:hypothetical protein
LYRYNSQKLRNKISHTCGQPLKWEGGHCNICLNWANNILQILTNNQHFCVWRDINMIVARRLKTIHRQFNCNIQWRNVPYERFNWKSWYKARFIQICNILLAQWQFYNDLIRSGFLTAKQHFLKVFSQFWKFKGHDKMYLISKSIFSWIQFKCNIQWRNVPYERFNWTSWFKARFIHTLPTLTCPCFYNTTFRCIKLYLYILSDI